ncbi:MAG: Holliday junction branch migration protein RuvA [Elusimicrobia bacterium]|nr:Holliday junction branch migration protein RuvA [Elusimicrobiota bacterium]
MIAYLKGALLNKKQDSIVLNVNGIGYEVFMTQADLQRLPPPDNPMELYISESIGMYGGGTTLYGFLQKEEKEIYLTLKSHVPNTGAKKALEYLDKAAKSLPDFRRAILEKDARILAGVFGFTRKTAEKLIVALKDKVGMVPIPGPRKFKMEEEQRGYTPVLNALISLGYRATEARSALELVTQEIGSREASPEEMVRLALKRL